MASKLVNNTYLNVESMYNNNLLGCFFKSVGLVFHQLLGFGYLL